MKQILTLLGATILTMVSCGEKGEKKGDSRPSKTHPEWASSATIYELNTRQLTPEGTFAAAEAQLPRLKEMGVDIIWIMPIQPIGKLERKGSLGSYYAISDYTAFNPEFGTRADFERFLSTAHSLGIKVILDWVANHTSPDHVWAKNPGWHKRDSLGKMKVQYDWTDITELDYENSDMRQAMKSAMEFWVDSIGVDGFRCDMAMLVPTDFWQGVVGDMQSRHPDLFMLSEAEEPELMSEAFDMYYGWELHHILNAIAQQKITPDTLARYFSKAAERFPEGAIRMNFTSNHDENSWSGSESERMGEATQAMAALTYLVPGMPLIYSGQEFGNAKRIRFFDKDTIAFVADAPQTQFYSKMNAMRKAHPALQIGEMEIIQTDLPQAIFAMERKVGDDSVVAVFNFSDKPQMVNLQHPDHDKPLELKPWEYRIFE